MPLPAELEECKDDDIELERWTFMRLVVMGVIMLYRTWMTRARGLEQEDDPQDAPYHDHPKLTRWMKNYNVIFSLAFAGVIFVQSEGVGLVIYFATSAFMDNYTIYFVSNVKFCEYVIQVAIYSMSVLTFLPNCIIAYIFQGQWYDKGRWMGTKSAFVVLMVVCAMTSFAIRLLLVYHLGWDDAVKGWLTPNQYKVYIAVLVPPVVDAIQTALLITAALMTKEFDPPNKNSDSDATDSE